MLKSGFRIAQYDDDLHVLNDHVVQLLFDTRAAITKACEALNERNLAKAEEVAGGDDIVDREEMLVNKIVADLIMKYQPLSLDLRCILASMHIAWDLERVGDIAQNVAKRVLSLGNRPTIAARRLGPLVAAVLEQFETLIGAYEANDGAAALQILERDRDVDAAHAQATADLLAMMESDPSLLRGGVQLMSIAKSLERVGDHITNVAEQILYKIDGQTEFAARTKLGRG